MSHPHGEITHFVDILQIVKFVQIVENFVENTLYTMDIHFIKRTTPILCILCDYIIKQCCYVI